MANLKEIIILNDNEYAVSLIADYFAEKNNSEEKKAFDSHVKEFDAFLVGSIEAVGANLDEKLIGHVIYFQKQVANIVKIKGYADYHLVDHNHHKLLIRKDQTRNNL